MTRLLLDTNTLLWWLFALPQLGPQSRARIMDVESEVLVSAVSAVEISIKQTTGKLQAPDDLVGQLAASGFDELPFTVRHGVAVAGLPMHHRDPFDRMLIAQARSEGLTLLTSDRVISAYDIPQLSARD